MVKLRLTAKGDDKEKMEKELDEKFLMLKELVKEWLVSDKDENLALCCAKYLERKKIKRSALLKVAPVVILLILSLQMLVLPLVLKEALLVMQMM